MAFEKINADDTLNQGRIKINNNYDAVSAQVSQLSESITESYSELKEDLGNICNTTIIFDDWELGSINESGDNVSSTTRIRTSGYHRIGSEYFYVKAKNQCIGYNVFDEIGNKLFSGGWLEKNAEYKFKNQTNWKWRFTIDTGDLNAGNNFILSTEPNTQELTLEMGAINVLDDGSYTLPVSSTRVRNTGFYRCEENTYIEIESNVPYGINKMELTYDENKPAYTVVYCDGWIPQTKKTVLKNESECFYKFVFDATDISKIECKIKVSNIEPVYTGHSDIVSKTFKRCSVKRNLFSTQKRIGGIDLSSDIFLSNSNMHPITNTSDIGLDITQNNDKLIFLNNEESKQESKLWIGAVYPAFVCSFKVNDLSFVNSNSAIVLDVGNIKDGHHIYVGILRVDATHINFIVDTAYGGKTVGSRRTLSNISVTSEFSVMYHFAGSKISFWVKNNGENVKYLGAIDVTDYVDIRKIELRKSMSLYLGVLEREQNESATISNIIVTMTGGTGQADPRIIHYEDGTPIVKNGKIFLAMTTRGYNEIPYSYQGIYSMDIVSGELEILGMLSFNKGDGISRFWHATDILYNRNTDEWVILTVSHGDDHGLYLAITKNDIINGYHDINIEKKLNYTSVGNEEDPYLLYKDNMWYMLYVKGTSGYNLVLAKSKQIRGNFTDIATVSETSFTGSMIYVTGDTAYCVAGKGTDHFRVYSFPNLEYISELSLDLPLKSNNTWPVLYDYSGKTKLITFDRGKVSGNYSYGAIYEYELN